MALEPAPDLVIVDEMGDLILDVGTDTTDAANEPPPSPTASIASFETMCSCSECDSCDCRYGCNFVYPQKFTNIRLRVSKKALTDASPCFAAMLDSRFAEGQLNFNTQDPPTIPFPEDDPLAMKWLCQILHSDPQAKESVANYKLWYKIVRLCDKYFCREAIRGWFRAQMSDLLVDSAFQGSKLRDYGMGIVNIVKLTYMMEDYLLFNRASALFIRAAKPMEVQEVLMSAFEGDVLQRLTSFIQAFQTARMRDIAEAGQSILDDLISRKMWPSDGRHGSIFGQIREPPASREGPSIPRSPARRCSCIVSQVGILTCELSDKALRPQDLIIYYNRAPDSMLCDFRALSRIDYQKSSSGCPPEANCTEYRNTQVNELLSQAYEDQLMQLRQGICLGCIWDPVVDAEDAASVRGCPAPTYHQHDSYRAIEENIYGEANWFYQNSSRRRGRPLR